LSEMVGNHLWEPGEWTDDTAMTLCVAEGILVAPNDPVGEIGQRFLAWKDSRPKDIGNTIADALGRYQGDWSIAAQGTSAARQGRAAGNGSLMRTLPVALAYSDTETMLRQSARVSAMTHWDTQAEVCCALYCLWIHHLIEGHDREVAWQTAISVAQDLAVRENIAPGKTPGMTPLPASFWQRLEGVPNLTEASLQPGGYAGYVLDCLEAAAWWILKSESLEDALIGCVNMAGEADTIAAVAGGAAGAYWGASSIPSRWLVRLRDRERIEDISQKLTRLRLTTK
jgi:ADP-ribosyl-[dinitrogen reductase] hydrolase